MVEGKPYAHIAVKGDFFVNWLCDVCGYENKFNEEIRLNICLCCGEPASESKIIEAQKELDARHQEEEKKAQHERLRRIQEQRQQKRDHFIIGITRMAEAISVTAAVMVIISFVWIAVSFHSEGITLSAWKIQMNSNINGIFLKEYPDTLKDNLVVTGFRENMLVTIEAAGQIVEVQSDYLGGKLLLILESVDDVLNQVGEQVSTIGKNITNFNSQMRLNWLALSNRAKSNVQELIDTITGREGGSNG